MRIAAVGDVDECSGWGRVRDAGKVHKNVLEFAVVVGRFARWVVGALIGKRAVRVPIVDSKVHHTAGMGCQQISVPSCREGVRTCREFEKYKCPKCKHRAPKCKHRVKNSKLVVLRVYHHSFHTPHHTHLNTSPPGRLPSCRR